MHVKTLIASGLYLRSELYLRSKLYLRPPYF
jgi:hypothetical protein